MRLDELRQTVAIALARQIWPLLEERVFVQTSMERFDRTPMRTIVGLIKFPQGFLFWTPGIDGWFVKWIPEVALGRGFLYVIVHTKRLLGVDWV